MTGFFLWRGTVKADKDSYLGEIMRQFRKNRKLNQEKVAEALGISKATISEMESGHIAVTFKRWLDWCAVIKISPTDILRKWEKGEEFEKISQEKRYSYYRTVDMMIRYGFALELDTVMSIFQEVVDREKRRRAGQRSRKKLDA